VPDRRDDDPSDPNATPAEVPHPFRGRKSYPEPELQLVNGKSNGVHADGPVVPFPRHLPDLAPLPQNPTPLDVAVRYGSFAAFLEQWWPALHDRLALVDKLQRSVDDLAELVGIMRAEMRIRRTASWAWPLATGFLLATTLGAVLFKR
jgi:hypothetical protein